MILRRWIGKILLPAALAILTTPAPALAKTVQLQWKSIPSASKYEIVLLRDGKPIYKKLVSETRWSGNIPTGLLTYQIRAIDKMDRPGLWSQASALVISPEQPPKITAPESGKEMTFFTEENEIQLQWENIPGVQKYQLEIHNGNDPAPPQKLLLSENHYVLKNPISGKFKWTVTPVFEASAGFPEKLRGKTWLASTHAESDFEIEIKKLAAPDPVEPKGVRPPPKDGRIKFSWKAVEGAKAYSVQILDRLTKKTISQFQTDKTAVMLPFQREGDYEWKIQALATLPKTRDLAALHPSARGESSAAEFKVDRSALHVEGFGYVALSTMLAPYTYQIVSPSTGASGGTSSYAMTGRLSGEYWPGGSAIGASLGVDNTLFFMNNSAYNRMQFEGHAKYRLALSKDRFGWFFSPKIGVEYRQYPHITPELSTTGRVLGLNYLSLGSLGPSAGVDIRKQFSESWSLGIKTAYFIPLTLSGAPSGSSIAGSANTRNFGAGAQALYWLNKRWGLGFGAFYELRSISYQSGNAASSAVSSSTVLRYSAASIGSASTSKYEEVYMDAVYFFGSIIFSFGR